MSAAPPWEQLLAHLPTAVAVTDPQGRVLAATPEYHRLVDSSRPVEVVREVVERALLAGPGELRDVQERVLPARRGEDLRCRVRPWTEDSALRWCLVHVEDADHGGHDTLTGLVTRTAFVERLRQALAFRARHGGAVEVLVLDVDRFKEVNDRYGHVAGDEVLVEVARRLQAVSRPEDTVCRWGGDEFVLLLAGGGSGEDGAEAVGQRVVAVLREPYVLSRGQVLAVTTSWGSVTGRPGDDPVEVMHQADLLMYERKRRHALEHRSLGDLSARLGRANARARTLHEALDSTLRRVRQHHGPAAAD